jgi:hypothetical protein
MWRVAANSQDNSKRSNPAEHLKKYKFQPGTSGNYSGRPKKAISPYYEKQAAKLPGLEMSSETSKNRPWLLTGTITAIISS